MSIQSVNFNTLLLLKHKAQNISALQLRCGFLKKLSVGFLALICFNGLMAQTINFSVAYRINCSDSVYAVKFTPSISGYNNPSLEWDFGDDSTSTDNSPIHLYAAHGIYPVKLTLNNNPISSIEKNIHVLLEPDASFTIDSISENIAYSSFVFAFEPEYFSLHHDTISGVEVFNHYYHFGNDSLRFEQNDFTFSWAFGDDSTSTLLKPIHAYQAEGDFDVTLTVSDRYGCSASFGITDLNVNDKFSPEKIPNTFTPNEDGINDFFIIQADGVNTIYKFQVFSPTGVLVHQSESRVIRWDGRNFAGEMLKTGTYFYVVEATSGNTSNVAKGVIYLFSD